MAASTSASVCTKQSIVAKLGESIPAPLAWAHRRTGPPPSDTSRLARLGHRSLVMIASEKRAPPSSESSAAARRAPPDDDLHVQRHADHAGRRHAHPGALDAQRIGDRIGHRLRNRAALLLGADVGVAAVHDHGAQARQVCLAGQLRPLPPRARCG